MGKLLCEKIYGMFGVEMRAYGQKLVTFCTHTHTDTRGNLSSTDSVILLVCVVCVHMHACAFSSSDAYPL